MSLPIVLHMRRDLRPWRLAYWRFRWAMRIARRTALRGEAGRG